MTLLSLLVTIVIWGLILWLCWWAIGAVGLPEPFSKVATVILVLVSVIVVIELLTGQLPPFHLPAAGV